MAGSTSALNVVFAMVNFALAASLFLLICFHIVLFFKGMTTYEYITFNLEKAQKLHELKIGTISKSHYNAWLKVAVVSAPQMAQKRKE